MPLESADSTSAAPGSLQAFTCVTILLALLAGGVAVVRLCVDFVQLLVHVQVVMPG